ncbi:hypothetical protein NBRC116494_33110 [Aurantivibrio plasticivorans]
MAAVKGTKSTRLKVVPHRPYFQGALIAGFVCAVILTAIASYWLGNSQGQAQQAEAITERDELRIMLDAKTREAEALSQKVANLSLAREVDQASNEDVRGEVISLKEEIAALQEDIAFYRGLMAPTENRRGLTIGSVELSATGVPRRYDYKVVVQQLATNHNVLSGSLTFNIVGREGEQVRKIPLKDLSSEVNVTDIRLRFKYFQNIAGQLELPLGFEPQRIELVAKTTGRDAAVVEKMSEWLPDLPREVSRKPVQVAPAAGGLVQPRQQTDEALPSAGVVQSSE